MTSLIDDTTRSVFRDLLAGALQELIEDELTARIGAGLHERTDSRTNQRNGHRPRVLLTPAGDVDLAIPKTGVVLPVAAGPAAAGRPGVVGGDHDRLRPRGVHEEGR